MRVSALILTAVFLTGCGPRTLTDADLVAYASTTYDKGEMQDKHLVLGVHSGVRVVVDFPCADLCPKYTTRIIHYDLPADKTCAALGGTTVLIATPTGAEQVPMPYCVPRVLADRVRTYPGPS